MRARDPDKPISRTPLMRLGTEAFNFNFDRQSRRSPDALNRTSEALLIETFQHLEYRLSILSDAKQNHKNRSSIKWLTKWRAYVEIELERRDNEARMRLWI